MKRRFVSFFMAAALTFTSLPVDQLTVWAQEPETAASVEEKPVVSAAEDAVQEEPEFPAEDTVPAAAAEADDAVAAVVAGEDPDDAAEADVSEIPEGLISVDPSEDVPEMDAFTDKPGTADEGVLEDCLDADDLAAETDAEEEFEVREDIDAAEVSEEEEILDAASDEELYAAENASSDAEILEEALAHPLTANADPITVTYNSDKWIHYYSYTPENTTDYTVTSYLSSSSNSVDTYMWLYELTQEGLSAEEFSMPSYVDYNDDGAGANNQFKLKRTLIAGNTYIYKFAPYGYGSNDSAYTGNGTTSVSFDRDLILTGAEVKTGQISTYSSQSWYRELELELEYEDGTKTATVQTYDRVTDIGAADGDDNYYVCAAAQGSYEETIYVRFYQDGNQVDAPGDSGILDEAVYTVEPYVYRDGEAVAFTQSTLNVTAPEFTELSVGSSVDLDLEPGEDAYYKFTAAADLHLSLWKEGDDGYSLAYAEYLEDAEGSVTSVDDSLYEGQGNGRDYKLASGETVYLRFHNDQSEARSITLHLDQILEAAAFSIDVDPAVAITSAAMEYNAYRTLFPVEVTWSDGSKETLEEWDYTSQYVGAGDARKSVVILYADSQKGGERIGLVFKENGAYVNFAVPYGPYNYNGIPVGKTYTLLPFVYDNAEYAENWADYAAEFTYTLNDPTALELDVEGTVSAAQSDYAWATFTAPADGTYYAQGTYEYSYGSGSNSGKAYIYSYTRNTSTGLYQSGSSSYIPSFKLSEGDTVLLRMGTQSYETEYKITVSRKYQLTEAILEDAEGSVFDTISNNSYPQKHLSLNLVYGSGETTETKKVDLSNGYRTYRTVDGTRKYYFSVNGPFSESIYIDFFSGEEQVDMPVYSSTDGTPETGSYTIKATVSYRDEDGASQTMVSDPAAYTLADPAAEVLAVGDEKDYTLEPGQSLIYQITAPEGAGDLLTSFWQQYKSGYSYFYVYGYTKTEEGRYVQKSDFGGSYQNSGDSNGRTIRLSPRETLYLRIAHPSSYEGESAIKGVLHLDAIRQAEKIEIKPVTNPVVADRKLLRNSSYEWLTAEVTWSDGTASTISRWNYTSMRPGADQTISSVRCLYSDYKKGEERIAVAFRDKTSGSYVNAPNYSSDLPLGKTYEVVPFIYDLPAKADDWTESAAEVGFTLGDGAPELEAGEKTAVSAVASDYHVAVFTASEDSEYYVSAEWNSSSLYPDVYLASEEDPGMYVRSDSSATQKPSFFLKEGEKAVIAVRNSNSTRQTAMMTVLKKYPLTGIALSDGEGSVFDLGFGDGYSKNPAELFQVNFVYGEGEAQTTETASLTNSNTEWDYSTGSNVRYYYAFGPYGERVNLYFTDEAGTRVNAPATEDGRLPAEGSYPVQASVDYTDPISGETVTYTADASLILSEPEFTELSLKKNRAFTVPYRGLDYFAYTPEEAGTYALSAAESSIWELRVSRFTKEDSSFLYEESDYLYRESTPVSFDLEADETYYFTVRNTSNSSTGKGTLKLTKIRDVTGVSLTVDPEAAFTISSLEGSAPYLTAAYTTEDGKSGSVTAWSTTYVQIGGSSYRVLYGSGDAAESIGVVYKLDGEYVDVPFQGTYDGFYGSAEYTLQAFRLRHPEEIDAFAVQNPAAEAVFDLSAAAPEVQADKEVSFDSLSESEKWFTFTAEESGRYFLKAENPSGVNLYLYKKTKPDSDETRVWYGYENNSWYNTVCTLEKGDELVVALRCSEAYEGSESVCRFNITKAKAITSVKAEDRSVVVPAYSSDYSRNMFGLGIQYEDEDSFYEPDYLSYGNDYISANGRYGEMIYIYFYDAETGNKLDTVPAMGQYHYDYEIESGVYAYQAGTWEFEASVSYYDPETQKDVPVVSGRKTLTQTEASFNDMHDGDTEAFALAGGQDGFYRFISEEKAAYRYWMSDGNYYNLPGYFYTYDESTKTYARSDNNHVYIYNNDEDDEDSDYGTVRMDESESRFLVVNNNYASSFTGVLHLQQDSALGEDALDGAIALKNGYRSALSLQKGKTQYYTFTPDDKVEDLIAGEYTFLDDYKGRPTITLYSKYGASWVRDRYADSNDDYYDSDEGSSSGRQYIREDFEAGNEYVIAVTEEASGTSSNYIYFSRPSEAAKYAIHNMPSEMSMLTVPSQMGSVSVTVTMADGSTEEVTGWQPSSLYGYYEGSYLNTNYGTVLTATSALTGQQLYLAAVSGGNAFANLATNYSYYNYGRYGDFQVHLFATETDDENYRTNLRDLTTPQDLTIKAPSEEDIAVISPDTEARNVVLAEGQARVYRLGVNSSVSYTLKGLDSVNAGACVYRVNEASTSSSYQMMRQFSTSGNFSWSWTPTSVYAPGTYLVVYASENSLTQRVKLISSTASVKSVSLEKLWDAPTFIEGLYWNSSYWTVTMEDGVTASVAYAGEDTEDAEYEYTNNSRSVTDVNGNSLQISAYLEGEDGGLVYQTYNYRTELAPGTYYAAVRNSSNKNLPYPAPGKTITSRALLSDISAIEFQVISREDAVKGHDFLNGSASLKSEKAYYAGASYTADANTKVKFTSSCALRSMVLYDAETGEEIDDVEEYDSVSYIASLEKGRTYQVFVLPYEAGDFTICAEKAKSIREAIVSSHLDGSVIGTDEYIYTKDFYTAAVYEDGNEASFQGSEEDIYTNYFVYEARLVKDGEESSVASTLDDDTSLAAGTYHVRARVNGTDIVSSNYVTITVNKADDDETEEIGLDEIKTVPAGEAQDYVFTPAEDGLYSIISNGDIYEDEFRLIRSNGSGYYIEELLPGISSLEAGKKYLVRTWKSGSDQYISVTKRNPVKLPAEGITRTLIATGNQKAYLLIEAQEDASWKLEATADASGSNVKFNMNFATSVSGRGYYNSTGMTVTGTSVVRHFSTSDGNLHLIRLEGYDGGIGTYTVKLTQNSAKLASWKLLASAATDLPRMFASYYCNYVAKVQETFTDGTTGDPIYIGATGKYGDEYDYEYDWEGNAIDLEVWHSDDYASHQTQRVSFNTDYTIYPFLSEGTASTNGRNADGVYIYRFNPPQDSAYSVRISGDVSYRSRIYTADSTDDYEEVSGETLKKGTTYLICAVPYNGVKGSSSPSVTVSPAPAAKVVSSIEAVKGPNVVLHQEEDRTGITINVTYTDNTTATVTFGYNEGRDSQGNYFYAERAIVPGSEGTSYRYRIYHGDSIQCTLDVPVTAISELPAIAVTAEEARSSAAVVAGGAFSRWFRFTPTETAVYDFCGTIDVLSASGSSSSGSTSIESYAASVYPAEAGTSMYSPYRLTAGKTYLIRHYAYAGGSARLGLYAAKAAAVVTTRYAQDITYIFQAQEGTERELPEEVLALNPAKGYENYTKTVLQNDEPDLTSPELYEIVEEKDGDTTAGYWTFEGYDTTALIATNQNDKTAVTITGTWSFAEAVRTVTYAFESDTEGMTLPDELVSTLLPEKETWAVGKTITPPAPAKTEYETIDGCWTFTGYDQNSVTIGASDVTVTGKWIFAEETHDVTYRFVSGTEGKELPQEVTDLMPAGQTGLKKGSRVAPVQPKTSEVEDAAGRWIFAGYDGSASVTVRRNDITFTGTWNYVTEVHTVNYVFVSSDGRTVDQAVLDLLPQPSVVNNAAKGTVITVTAPSATEVETEHGLWSFDGYDRKSAVVGNEDVTITGIWTYADDKHMVRYEFISDDGADVPSDVLKAIPGAHEEIRGTEVTPKKPIRTSVEVGTETWTFLGYDQESVKMGAADVTFTGTWTHAEVHSVKYRFVSDTKDADFDDDSEKFEEGETTTADQIEALIPGDESKHTEVWKKGETKTLIPAAGITVSSKSGVWTFKGYTKDYVKYAEHTYIDELTMGSEDVTLYGVWTFDETRVQVSYRFLDENGNAITDESVTALLPAAETVVKGDSYTPVKPEETEVDGEHGIWTFKGYDPRRIDEIGNTNIEITGTWQFTEVQTTVIYQYQSVSEDNVTDEVYAAAPKPADGTVRMGDTLTVPDPAVKTVPDATGNWTFQGWHLLDSAEPVTSLKVGKTTLTIVGDWAYKPEEHEVKYVFEKAADSQPADLALPEGVTALLPSVTELVRKGSTVTAIQPVSKTVEDETGYWTFNSYTYTSGGTAATYDASNPPKMGTEDITFTGTWTHTVETHTLSYSFVCGKSGEVPDDHYSDASAKLTEATADLTVEKTLTKGDAVVPAVFADVETTYGNWTYDGFENESSIPAKVGKQDIVIEVKWTYADEDCPITYADFILEYENGTTAPAPVVIQALKPSGAPSTAVKGTSVDPVAPTQDEIEVDGVTWHFGGYTCSHEDQKMVKGGITFTGTWNQRKKYQVSYVFVSVTEDMPLPAEIEALKPTEHWAFENEEVDLKDLPEDKKRIPTENGNWTFDGFNPSGKITLTDNVTVTGKWNYADEEHKVSYTAVSSTNGKAIPEEVTAVMPAQAAVVKGNQAALVLPSKELVETADGHWMFDGYTVNGTEVSSEEVRDGYAIDITTEDVTVSAIWKFEEHQYGAGWTTVQPATTTDEGSMQRVCDVCGYKETQVIPKLPLPNLPLSNPEGDINDPTSVAGSENAIVSISNDGDPAGSSFAQIQAKSTKQTADSITITWNAVPGAAGYIVYGNMCGTANKFKRLAKLGAVTSYTYGGLSKGTYYKFIVVAYQMIGGTEKVISSSKVVHVVTKGSKKFTNIKKLKLNKKNIKLKLKKKFKLKVTATVLQSKKLKNKNHRKVIFESSNTAVATVTKKGVVKAVGKGTCFIYVYAQNGVFVKAKVTVK